MAYEKIGGWAFILGVLIAVIAGLASAALDAASAGYVTLALVVLGLIVGFLVMMFLAIALNLCSEADAFIAAAFRGVMPRSAQMAFMVLGPMLDLKLILMYFTVFRIRVILVTCSAVFLGVLSCALVLSYGLGGYLFGW